MSLYNKTLARYGSRVCLTGLFKCGSKIKSARGFRRITGSYLLDDTKVNYVTPEAASVGGGDYLRKAIRGEAPLRPGVDYKPGLSKVWSFGRANYPVYQSHPNPLALSDQERLDRIVEWWVKDRSDAKVLAHHLIFSLDPRLTAALGEREATKRLPLDSLLIKCVGNALLEYQSKLYPRDQLGFLVGVHHDRVHAHAHVLVHPITANGRRVNFSTNEMEYHGGKKVNVPYQAHLKKSFTRQTDLLSEYCFGKETDFTWIGREPDKGDVAQAREELVLAERSVAEPEANDGTTPDECIKNRLKARAKLLSAPNYPHLIRRARQEQRQMVENSITDRDAPPHQEVNFDEIAEKLETSARGLSEVAGVCASMFGEMEREADRAGPCLVAPAKIPISRSSAFGYLRDCPAARLPSPLTAAAFLRRRTARHRAQIDRFDAEVRRYAEKGGEYARTEIEQHVRLADSVAMLLAYSGEVTGYIPEYLQEPVPGLPRVPDERLIPDLVTRDLRALSRDESRHFQPVDRSLEYPGDPSVPLASVADEEALPETATRLPVVDYPSSLGRISDGVPDAPSVWQARLRSIVTLDT